ncbi:MAG: peptidyl-prolyl cis-trans isomerase [Polyangiaceae bacterium]|nr:peptidyl-prolyl cis-trans isomerase [Polyangiaceae bacterium]
MPRLRNWIREPLVHFVFIGAVIFSAHAYLRPPPRRQITVSADFIAGLRAEHRARTGAPPTAEETQGLIHRYIEEEVLHREALALGLDVGDIILRRRLVQKMQFLLDDEAASVEPSESELQSYLDANAERYRLPAVISFRHVFVSRDRRGEGAIAEAERLLDSLRGGADSGSLGDPFVQGSAWSRRTAKEIDAVFGAAFAEKAFAAKEGSWSGPIESSYGAHLVWVSERSEGRAPALSEVRARVRDDWRAERREEARKVAMDRLRARYQVVIESNEAAP